jgi:uncharacterized membrane-anchored protein YitT (DUF2179 family)
MKSKIRGSVYFDFILMAFGTGLVALAINSIYEPISMVTGGFSGLGIILKAITEQYFTGGIPIWFTNLVLNIPLFIIGMKIKGVKFIGRTLFATVFLSIWLFILPSYTIVEGDYILVAVFGGAITGTGVGLVLMGLGTTGGSDMLAVLIQHKLSQYSVPQIMLVVDGIIVLVGAYLFGMNKALYAIISIVVSSRLSDGLIEGINFSKTVYIITDYHREVAEAIMMGLERGVTGINATGMYSQKEKNLLFCVVSKKEIVELKEIVYQADPKSFVIVSDAKDVLGEGFGEYKK